MHLRFLGTAQLPPCPCCNPRHTAWSSSVRAHPDLEEPSAKPGKVQKAGLEGWAEGWRKQSLLIKIPLFVPGSEPGVAAASRHVAWEQGVQERGR